MTQSNSTFGTYTKFLNSIIADAKAEANGLMKRSEFIIKIAIGVAEGVVNLKDADEIWTKYREAVANKVDGQIVAEEKSAKQRISELRQVILAADKPGVSLADRLSSAREIILDAKAEGNVKGNTHDCFIAIARAQMKVEGRNLNDDEVRSAIAPSQKSAERNEKKELEKRIKDLKVLINGTEGTPTSPPKEAFPSDAAKAALHLLEKRLAELTL
jgi:hypothetical protein